MSLVALSALLAGGRDHPLALRGGAVRTLGQFRADVAACAAGLAGCRRVGVSCADTYRFAVALFAAFQAGAEAVLPPGPQPAVLAGLSAAWDVLLGDADIAEGEDSVDELPAADGRLVFFTSGSTGAPKRVERRLEAFDAEVAALDRRWGERAGAPVMATVPHQHVYGLTFAVLWPLASARPFAARSHAVWETLLAELRPGAALVTSPAHLGRLAGLTAAACPQMILSAGAPLPHAVAVEAARLFGTAVTEILGSTETGAIATRVQQRPQTPWTALPGAEIRRDDDGGLAVRAPWVADWHRTGDLIAADGDGFHLLGRSDRVTKIEGKRVGLAAVEQALLALDEVVAAAVVPLTGDGRDALGAAVVLTAGGRAALEALGRFRFGRHLAFALADRLEPVARPRRWRFVAALPETALGKRPLAAIAALFAEDR